MPQAILPPEPLERFCELSDALLAEKRWRDGTIGLRFAASSLVTLPGEPAVIAARLRLQAERLEQRASWSSAMKSELRFVVAALLMHGELEANAFADELERVEALFKGEGMKRGTLFSQLAALLLMLDARDRGQAVDERQVARCHELYAEMKSRHGFLTGQDDLPACAFLTRLEGSPAELADRCERFYGGLADLGFRRGNALQGVSHILASGPGDDDELMLRFRVLYSRFDEAGLWMNSGDYDEVALLSFLEEPADRVVGLVLEHREQLQARKPKPGRELGFVLACGTAFLQLLRDPADETLRGARNVLGVQAILQAQQAVMIAAMAGSTAAVTAAHGS